jgi:CMP-N-acetylneuraminic acid synthetase
VPRKNLADLGGKPLVQHSLEAGLASSRLDALLLSSDDPEILAVGERLGVPVVLRPAELAADDAPMLGTALHALDHAEQELGLRAAALVLLQPTSPFRTGEDVDGAIEAFERSGADTLASVVPVDQHPCNCVRQVDGRLERAVPLPYPNARRQDLPQFHYVDGAIYIGRADFLRSAGVFVDERTATYVLPRSHGLNIDDAYELDIARGLLAVGTLA